MEEHRQTGPQSQSASLSSLLMRPKMSSSSSQKVPALIVHQWLEEWDEVNFAVPDFRRKPEPRFYIFSLPVHKLRRLSGIYPRQADKPEQKTLRSSVFTTQSALLKSRDSSMVASPGQTCPTNKNSLTSFATYVCQAGYQQLLSPIFCQLTHKIASSKERWAESLRQIQVMFRAAQS